MRREEAMKELEPVLARPREAGLLLIGFNAWSGPQPDGQTTVREHLGRTSTRAIWDRQRGRVALTVTEFASAREAIASLADELESNQLATVPRGPDDLGEISFVHPAEAPPAVFFARGNLRVAVYSIGHEPVDVVPFARRVDAELRARPEQAREGGVDVRSEKGVLRATPRWRGPDGYLKVIAPGAELRKQDDAVVVEGAAAAVEVFYIEPGRETYSARVAI